jgi:hypothetical protein
VAALALLLGGCAWSNRDNRPVWNAFEEHLVPEDDAAFVASLPLTFPGGLLAIVIDSFVVHPAQVADDAARDARDVWDGTKWREEYYTELVKVPFRAIGTPIVLVGSFVGRSCFDIEPHGGRSQASRDQADARRARQAREWLDSLVAGKSGDPAVDRISDLVWSDELQKSFETARRAANAEGRLKLYEVARENRWPPWKAEPTLGLRDPDPVVRYQVLEGLWRDIPGEIEEELRNDPNEMVRLLARKRFPER